MMDTLGLMDKTLYDIGVSHDLLDVWDSDLNTVGQSLENRLEIVLLSYLDTCTNCLQRSIQKSAGCISALNFSYLVKKKVFAGVL